MFVSTVAIKTALVIFFNLIISFAKLVAQTHYSQSSAVSASTVTYFAGQGIVIDPYSWTPRRDGNSQQARTVHVSNNVHVRTPGLDTIAAINLIVLTFRDA